MGSYALGVRAESLAAAFLRQEGFQILQQNFRSHRGEIDLIALEDRTLCFVEVRYRGQDRFGHPSSTISRLKQRRIIKTASVFLATRWAGPACACRFDVVTISGGLGGPSGPTGNEKPPELTLLRNAFELPAA